MANKERLGAGKGKTTLDEPKQSVVGQTSNKPERSLQVINTEPPLQHSQVHSHAVSSRPKDDEDFKTFVTNMILEIKAKVDKNESEMKQFRLVTTKNVSNNEIMRNIDEIKKETSSLRETIRQFDASLNRRLYNQARAADSQIERVEKTIIHKLDSLQK